MPYPLNTSRGRVLSRRLCLLGLGLLPLSGCKTSAGFVAQAGASGLADEPVLHVITTRRLSGNGTRAPFYDSARAPGLAYALARLTPPDTSLLSNVTSLVTRDFAVERIEPINDKNAAQGFAEALRGRDTLLFVHGYNQTFEAAAYDAAQLSAGIGFQGNSALFAWPSKGGLLDYGYDRESALLARDPLADALAALLQDPFGAKVNIVAHSMGTLVTLEALRSYRDRYQDSGLERLGALVFAAPDIDIDVFKAGLAKLGRFRDKMVVITATNDRALDLSRRLAGGERAGALPASALEGLGVKVIDATEFASGFIRHDVFVANADVRAVIKRAVARG